MSKMPWKTERLADDTALSADARIPPEEVRAVHDVTAAVGDAVREVLEDSALGVPEQRVILMRWAHGASALVAEPADDPLRLLATLWNALTATLDSLDCPVQEFLDLVMKEDGDADPR